MALGPDYNTFQYYDSFLIKMTLYNIAFQIYSVEEEDANRQ